MKTYIAGAIVMTVLAVDSPVNAQTCWTAVSSWKGTYSLTGIGSGEDTLGEYDWTVDQGVTGTPNMSSAQVSCSLLAWSGFDSSTTGGANDIGNSGCPGLGSIVFTGGPIFTALGGLQADPSGGAYKFLDAVGITATLTDNECSNTTTEPVPGFTLWPFVACNGDPVFHSFPLPASPGTLTQTAAPLTGFAVCPWGVATNWTLSFTLNPVYNADDDCHQAANSTIGCQNQSLGEDVPVVGTGFNLHYEGDRASGAGGDSVAAADALMIGGWTLSVHHAYDSATNTLFLGDGRRRNGYQMGSPVSFNGNNLLTSEDGSEVYVISGSTGQHLQTVRPLTGALEYQFGYDAAGNLITVTDASGNVTTIKRDASEHATSIVSPYGQKTKLSVDSNGFLSEVTDPLGKSQIFTNTSTGLLTSRTDANGNIFNYTYDSQGRLTKDADPVGGYTTLTRTNAASGFGWTVAQTTAMGRTSGYQTTLNLPWAQTSTSTSSEQHTNTWPNGLQATSTKTQQNGQLSNGVTLPDGTSDSTTEGPDPIWGIQVPVATSDTLTYGNLTMNSSESRTATLGAVGNPFTLTAETDTQTVNGRNYTSTFTGSNLTYVNTTPVGRTRTVGLDSLERIASTQIEGLTATDFSYDSRGRLVSAIQGSRKASFSYNSNGFLASVTDPLKLKTSFAYDADGHLLATTLPDGRAVGYAYDANGNLTSVTPPGKSAHDFAYNAVNLPETYTPPTVLGTGATTYAYDLDRDLTTVTRPDGETINYGYDTAGRLISVSTPTGLSQPRRQSPEHWRSLLTECSEAAAERLGVFREVKPPDPETPSTKKRGVATTLVSPGGAHFRCSTAGGPPKPVLVGWGCSGDQTRNTHPAAGCPTFAVFEGWEFVALLAGWGSGVRSHHHLEGSMRNEITKRAAFVTSEACRWVLNLLVVGTIALTPLTSIVARAQSFSVLHNFGTTSVDAIAPQNPGIIAQGRDGNLYSTSPTGGTFNVGTVFQITPAGVLSVIYSFDGVTAGNPHGGLILGNDGNFYGTALNGASNDGIIFQVNPDGALTVLYQFTGASPDGGYPLAAPIQGSDGNFYGTAFYGGSNGLGSVYKLTAAGVFTTLYSFSGSDGKYPRAPLVQGTDGNFYGNTSEGGKGAGNSGTVFRITPAGKLKVLYNFDITHGQQPYAPLVEGSNGDFYGTTTSGGGTEDSGVVFSITPAGHLTVLHSLNNLNGDGYLPYAGLVLASDGNFYGSATNGGTGTYGTLFSVNAQGTYSVLYNFLSFTGIEPEATMVQHTNGILYGDTMTGGLGSYCTCGTFYRLDAGLVSFVSPLPASAKVGKSIGILGQGFTGSTAVSFNGRTAKYQVVSDTYLTVKIPNGATTGPLTVTTPGGVLTSKQPFRVTPVIKSFGPLNGPVGTQVMIEGVSLTQATKVTFGGVPSSSFAVNSDTQVTANVPTGAITGHIAITTPGGTALSPEVFTITP